MTELNVRQLATKIHQACKEHGLKQTVILDVLVKHKGMRSIQCSDQLNTNLVKGHALSEDMLTITYDIRKDIYCHYPDNDLLGVSLDEIINEPKVDVDDGLFQYFFNKAYSDIFDIIPALERAYSLFEYLELFIAQTNGGVEPHSEKFISDSPLSKCRDVELIKFIINELDDCSKGEDYPCDAQCNAMEKAYHDIESILEGLNLHFYNTKLTSLKEG